MKKFYSNIILLIIASHSFSQTWVSFGADTLWRPTGNSSITGLHVADNKLLASGNFMYGSGVFLNRVGSWDTFQWTSLDSGINDGSLGGYCFQIFNNELYMGGDSMK